MEIQERQIVETYTFNKTLVQYREQENYLSAANELTRVLNMELITNLTNRKSFNSCLYKYMLCYRG